MSKNNLEKATLLELYAEADKRQYTAGYMDVNPNSMTGNMANKILKKIHTRK